MDKVYHYTSQAGLIGMLSSGAVWCTNSNYLNDSTEFSNLIDKARYVSGELYANEDYYETFAWFVREELGSLLIEDFYVSSFSECPDLLSQWRGYCPKGSGYCLGFDRKLIESYCINNNFRFEKCVYSNRAREAAIAELFDIALESFPKQNISIEEFNALDFKEQLDHMLVYRDEVLSNKSDVAHEVVRNLSHSLLELACRFKHESFHEEAEWRIVANKTDQNLCFRDGASYVIPYIVLDILKSNKAALREVIVGPNPSQLRARSSVEILLKENGYSNTLVRGSNIPYNYW
ncbi:DUF2971 domain-containing protein [Cobetia sp. UCD-24C]|uniref:DUF2971 domain-containing protein n=1 Tax=Cobetia sp. UCD-24C TaxID=1716176 RepID=UPI0009E9DFA1|nr:DUF2971 domain-containing protein [Cobetia sp. UCD-24C]